VFYRALGDP